VQDSSNLDPISEISGGHRYSFEVGGQLTLVRHCYARGGRHDFVLASHTPGPNVFVDCAADNAYSESGPHHRWATGTLYDNVFVQAAQQGGDIGAGDLGAYNRGMVEGQGWAGANMVFWNSGTDAKMIVEKPPTAQNWAIGVSGPVVTRAPEPLGYVESVGTQVEPSHLYDAQLQDRLAGHPALVDVSRQVQLVKHPFPKNLNQTGELVTITNVSEAIILGPVQVVLTGLPKGVTVAGATGRTVTGEPILTLPVNDLGPGNSVALSLRFTGPVPAHLTYNLVVFSGPLRPTLPPPPGPLTAA
jgi:hypothetical protein